MSKHTKAWLKAAGIRAVKTAVQTAVATIGTAAVLGELNWIMVTYEGGDTSLSSQANGGSVMERNRAPADITGAYRPWYNM